MLNGLGKMGAFGAACFIALALAIPTPAQGQLADCGKYCGGCMEDGFEGYSFHPTGHFNMSCVEGTSCMQGGCPHQNLISEDAPDDAQLMDALRTWKAPELRALIAQEGHRLLIHGQRNMVVVRGAGCDPDALGSMVIVQASTLEVLREMKVTPLSTFIAEVQSET